MNVHYPPNQPTARRCFEFGRAVAEAVHTWDQPGRIAVVATGGLSVGVLDIELDRAALRAMETQDLALMDALPRYRMQGATGEVLSWLACAGASGKLQMELVDYIPAYRSPGGHWLRAGVRSLAVAPKA